MASFLFQFRTWGQLTLGVILYSDNGNCLASSQALSRPFSDKGGGGEPGSRLVIVTFSGFSTRGTEKL